MLVDARDEHFLLSGQILADDLQYAVVVLEAEGHLLDVELLRYHDLSAHLELCEKYLLAQPDAFEQAVNEERAFHDP